MPTKETARDGGIDELPFAPSRRVGELGMLLLIDAGTRVLESDGPELDSPALDSTSVVRADTDADAVPQLDASSSGDTIYCIMSLPRRALELLFGLPTFSCDMDARCTESVSSKKVDCGVPGRMGLAALGRAC